MNFKIVASVSDGHTTIQREVIVTDIGGLNSPLWTDAFRLLGDDLKVLFSRVTESQKVP